MLPIINYLQNHKEPLQGKRILVIGDISLDRTFLCHHRQNHAKHAEEQQFDIEPFQDPDDKTFYPGDTYGEVGASCDNVILASSFGAVPALLTATGDDEEGDRVRNILQGCCPESLCLKLRNTQTTTRFRWFVWRDNHYRFEYRINKEPIPYAALDVPASQTPFAHAEQTAMQLFAQAPNQDWLRRQLSLADAVLINDTQKGFLSPDLVDQIGIMIREENRSRQNQGKSNLFTLVDPKNDWDKFSNVPVTLIKSNQHEACHSVSFTDIQFADDESFDLSHADKHSLIKLGKQLHSRFQNYFPHLIVTLGKKGAIKIEHRQGRPVFEYFPGVPPVHQATFDTTHCGDMFATALLASQLLGEPLKDSLAFANYVGSLQYSMALRKKVALENILEQRNLEHLERNYKQAIPWETEDRKVMSEILAFVDARREVAFGGAAILLSRTQYATLWVLATNCNRNKPVRGHKDLASGLVEKLHEMEKEPLAAADLSRRERKTPGPINRLQSTEDGVSNQASRNVLSDLRKRLSELAPANAAARRLLSKLPKGKVLLNLAESQIQFG